MINKDGAPLMPTSRHGRIRRLLKCGLAKVIHRCPFTIQLLYETKSITQPITLGVDAGSKHIGLSATTERKVLYEADVKLRTDIVDLLSTRREARRHRRYRKTRYRKPRFQNRVHSKKKGWLAPSIKQKIDCHLQVIKKVNDVLPVSKIVVEVASFDIQKIKKPDIQGVEYQQEEQLNFWNIREYVLFRDGHMCQCCKGKSKDSILNVHHIESRKTGGDAPNNLITLCRTCHIGYHNGKVKIPRIIKRGVPFRDATFMGVMRWAFYNKLKNIYSDISMTYGYITKNTRIRNGLPKEHYIDARCISGNPQAVSDGVVYFQKKVRCHNRQIHKFKILKGGGRKNNKAPYKVKGFRLFDKVLFSGSEYFIFGRRVSGCFHIHNLEGGRIGCGDVSYKKIKLLESAKHYLVERRIAHSNPYL